MMDHKNTLRMLGTHLWKKRKREKRKFNTIYSSKTYDTKKKTYLKEIKYTVQSNMPPGESLMSSHHFSPPCKRMKSLHTHTYTPHTSKPDTHTQNFTSIYLVVIIMISSLPFFCKTTENLETVWMIFFHTYSLNAPSPLRTNKPTKTKFLIGNFQYTWKVCSGKFKSVINIQA